MQQLNPAETFPLVRLITNHLDTDTYYVRAVVKNATTDAVLDTVDLEDKGNRYFRKNYKIPYDNTMARGRYITITTSVYTDSGYTTKSSNYGDEMDTYLIHERFDPNKLAGFGGGGGIDISAIKKALKEALKEEVDKLKFPKQKDFPKQKEYGINFTDISKGLTDIKKIVENIPKETVNLKSLENSVDDLIGEVQTKPVTPVTDLKPVVKAIDTAQKVRDDNKKEIRTLFATLEKKLMTSTKKTMEDAVQKHIPDIIQNNMKNASFSVPLNLGQPQMEEKRKKVDGLKAKFGIK